MEIQSFWDEDLTITMTRDEWHTIIDYAEYAIPDEIGEAMDDVCGLIFMLTSLVEEAEHRKRCNDCAKVFA